MLKADPNIFSVDTPNGRYYEHRLTGKRLWSVTTVLGRFFEKHSDGGLERWKMRVGLKEAEGIKRQAGLRGSILHGMLEKYVQGQDYKTGQMPINLYTFEKFKRVIDEDVTNYQAVEFPVFDPEVLKTAGRIDCIADYKREASIIDFKTSRRRKKVDEILSYFLQTSVYGNLYNRLYDKAVSKGAIILACDADPLPQTFTKKLASQRILLEIFGNDEFNPDIT